MNKNVNKQIKKFFDSAVDTYPLDSSLIVGWRSKEEQIIRFEILSRIADLNDATVLDVGCGVGDLYGFFCRKGIKTLYAGIDLHPKMISHAKKKYPGGDFLYQDFAKVKKKYDYVMASGTFNLLIEDNYKYIFEKIERMCYLAEKGVAFNLLGTMAPYDIRCSTLFYYDPKYILEYCRDNNKIVKIIDNYLPHEFTIYIYNTLNI